MSLGLFYLYILPGFLFQILIEISGAIDFYFVNDYLTFKFLAKNNFTYSLIYETAIAIRIIVNN